MSESIIYHTYKKGNITKNITTLAGLKRYATVNKENVLTFQELLFKNKFSFYHNLAGEISNRCRLCHKELPIFKIIESEKKVILTLCACCVKTPLIVNAQRFLTIFSEEIADIEYKKYCENKIEKWTTKNIPVGSLDFKIKKYGYAEGKRRYDDFCRKVDSTSVNYFLSKGLSYDNAVKACKQRQATFSKEICKHRYGEIEGEEIWAARQKKWQITLTSKSDSEIERLNQLKIWKFGGISRISQQLFEQISDDNARWGIKRDGNLGEKFIKVLDRGYMADFCLNNNIIEFNGDYWHANPQIYNHDHVFKTRSGSKLASQIWEADKNKIDAFMSLGYNVHIVWENEFRKNPDKVIKECKNFLKI